MNVRTRLSKFGQLTLMGVLFVLLVSACIQPITREAAAPAPADDLATAESAWQTYENPEAGFAIDYPAGWEMETLPAENEGQHLGVALTGEKGGVELRWGVGFGGACPGGYGTVAVADGELPVCHLQNADGAESWEQISKELGEIGFSARAYTSSPAPASRELILHILSTLRFN
ncbi:MAG: hypothetical protein KJZ93_26830 [Caldilineaceae bacterium]|nr:hypothetical protein [Caldilineaceae bacterium]